MYCSSGQPPSQSDHGETSTTWTASSARVVLVIAGGGTLDVTQAAGDLLEQARAAAAPAQHGATGRIAACAPAWAALCRHLGRCGCAPACPLAGADAIRPADPPRMRVVVTLASTRADAHSRLYRQLAREANVECRMVHAQAASWCAIRQAGATPDVLVIDRSWCDEPSLRTIAAITNRDPQLRVVVHDHAEANESLASTVIRHRFHGLLHAHCPPEIGVKAIRAVVRGELWLPRALLGAQQAAMGAAPHDGATSLESVRPHGALTRRQNEIVAHLRQGSTNKEIANRLGIKEDTVKKHLQAVFARLGVHRRALVALRNVDVRIASTR